MGFIEDFAKVDAKFGDDVLMTPRYLVWECKDCPSSFKQIHCFGDGKYCSYDKDHPDQHGQLHILEDMRERYIYEKYYRLNQREVWWNYMTELHVRCYDSITVECSRNVMEDLGI